MNHNIIRSCEAQNTSTSDILKKYYNPNKDVTFSSQNIHRRICQSEFLPSHACKATCYAFKTPPSWQEIMLVTRELLLIHPEQVMTVPVVRLPARVWIITLLPQFHREDGEYDQKKNGKNLSMRIKSKGLVPIKEGVGITPPPIDVWQECLQFSIQARMSPNWNRVGAYLFYSRDFLTTAVVDAVRPQLTTEYDKICMTSETRFNHSLDAQSMRSSVEIESTSTNRISLYLEGCQFRWKRIGLCDLQVRPDKLQKYMRGEVNAITYHHLGISKLCVLPNLTMGRLLSITRHIEQCKDIKDWTSMKRYWKNLYGYRLPTEEKDGAKFYCNIIFDQCNEFGRPSDNTIFCYPESCVRLHEPAKVFRHQTDREKIVDQFLADLRLKVPDICGLPLRFPLRLNTSKQLTPCSTNNITKRPHNMAFSSALDLKLHEPVEKKRPKLSSSMNCNEE